MTIILSVVIAVQVTVFIFFIILERFYPTRVIARPHAFGLAWVAINGFTVTWANIAMYHYASVDGVFDFNLSPGVSGLLDYLVYSFVAYW
ncbi:MAG: hypothetical protein AAFZ92_08580 [Pseudomonadota bacterium]